EWVEYLAASSTDSLASARRRLSSATVGRGETQLVRRLTHSQYNNTVRDLLGDYSRPALRFPPEDYVEGFKNQFRHQSMPPVLLDAAQRGALRSGESREREARRLLDSPLAAQALEEFFSQWLRFDRVLNASKERRRFPEFSPELAAAMVEETRRLLQHLVATNGNFMELLTADYGFLNSDLAAIYQLPAPSGQFELMRFGPATRRAGLLGQASFLAAAV